MRPTSWAHAACTAACMAALPALLAGCASGIDDLPPSTGAYAPAVPVAREPVQVATGAIWRPGSGDALLGRQRRFQPGDVVTVLLSESTQAQRAANGNVSRAAKNDVVPSGLTGQLGATRALAGVNLNAATVESKGSGAADQSNSLTGSISLTVVEVLANGNLAVRGEKQMALNQGSEVIQVRGIIRPEDISPNNTVQSRRLADAQFTYKGGGELASATRAGWGTRALLGWWPF